MNNSTPFILAIAMASAALGLFAFDYNWNESIEIQDQETKLEDVPESLRQTYSPSRNIYLPEMMFLVVRDTDAPGISRCKNMAYRTVDSFSRRVNSNLVRADKKLKTLADIVYGECINVVLVTHREGI